MTEERELMAKNAEWIRGDSQQDAPFGELDVSERARRSHRLLRIVADLLDAAGQTSAVDRNWVRRHLHPPSA